MANIFLCSKGWRILGLFWGVPVWGVLVELGALWKLLEGVSPPLCLPQTYLGSPGSMG